MCDGGGEGEGGRGGGESSVFLTSYCCCSLPVASVYAKSEVELHELLQDNVQI